MPVRQMLRHQVIMDRISWAQARWEVRVRSLLLRLCTTLGP